MKLARCPSCHSHIHLDTLIQDNNAKGLLAAVAKLPANLAANMVGYIALFRPAKSDLNNERASRLINEVLELTSNHNALLTALEQTILQIHNKRQNGISQPLKNHTYLEKVLGTIIEHHKHPMANMSDVRKPNVMIKAQGHEETPEENQRKFEETQSKYRD